MNIGKTAAIVLAAGQGKRMQAGQPKQFMLLGGRPVLYYALAAFEKSEVDEIILVTGADEIDYCRAEIVEHYGFRKVTQIIPGGKERYHSVACGLRALKQSGCDIVLIHDGARPFVTEEIIRQMIAETKVYHACVTGTLVRIRSRSQMKRASVPQRRTGKEYGRYRRRSRSLIRLCWQRMKTAGARKQAAAGRGIHYGRCHGRRTDDFPKSKAGRR